MPSVCFYFQVHQPFRLRRYSVFEGLGSHDGSARYFDEAANRTVCEKVAEKCYRPANRLMLEMIRRHAGRFRVSYSLTGIAMDQFARYAPDVLASFAELAATGCVEFLSETYHHSLAALSSPTEFRDQVNLHRTKLRELFGAVPRIFRNTELIYDNGIAKAVRELGFAGILAEGADHVLLGRSPNFVYRPAGLPGMALLLKNYGLSDDIAFRFSDRHWKNWPLTVGKFAHSVASLGQAHVLNLFMDYETFGEHQWAHTGIFEFFRDLPAELFKNPAVDFVTVSEALARYAPIGDIDVPRPTSWADSERDTSAWLGNAIQNNAAPALYEMEGPVKASGNPALLDDWRKLTTSDHFYYMSTKLLADGDVHAYFSPYETPYDAYINFMNVLQNLRGRVGRG